jgi:phosphonate transport system substrate-binding protein
MRYFRLFTVTCFLLVLTACSGPGPAPPSESGPGGGTVLPDGAPAKLVFAFQKQNDPRRIRQTADQAAAFLTERLGVPTEVLIPASYGASVQALVSNHAQVAYLSSIPFLLAREEAPVEMLLAELREDRTEYDSVFVVRKDSPYQSLADLRGKRVMWTSPTSTSGFVMAYSRLVDEGLLQPRQPPGEFFEAVNYAGGYDRALLAVFNQQADVCAVSYYTIEGERADVYSTPAMREQLRVLARTSGVPTHLVCIRADLPDPWKQRIQQALLDMSQERPELLADVYGAATFAVVEEEEHVHGAFRALQNTGLGLRGLVE